MKLAAACFVLLILLGAASRVAESRAVAGGGHVSPQRRHQHGRHHGHNDDDDDSPPPPHGRHHGHDDDSPPPPEKSIPKLFVFGDDAADTGNSDEDARLGARSSAWRAPFGMSDAAHGRQPSGRFSDGLVQSDYMAKIMGRGEAPPPYGYDDWDEGIDDAGLNFAVGGAVALDVAPAGVTTLRAQVQQLRDLLRDGIVERRDIRDSVALVAYSGNDYAYAKEEEVDDTVPKVIDELESVVSDLQDLGVGKVLVNTLVSYGCEPWLTRRTSNYSSCDDGGNGVSDKHNTALRDRLGNGDDDNEDVMVLDVNSVVRSLVEPKEGSTLGGKQLKERLRPCCEAVDPDSGDYCGLDDSFYLCDHPEEYFFWDLAGHPTQAGWRAVMQLLQGPIMQFLGISTLEHF